MLKIVILTDGPYADIAYEILLKKNLILNLYN